MPDFKTIHIIVSGKVQGVFFRASCVKKANESDITGWVRNITGGDVEIMATGTPDNLAEFTGWCNRGPSTIGHLRGGRV